MPVINCLVKMAKAHQQKSRVDKQKYFSAWVQSMEPMIFDNGMEPGDFLQLLNQKK